ncbi:prolipoprotein diacylglyceryl transferase [Deltaproteobacteria bacterium Smac51]|nr:prolipoprotein diacylglyceryl transferase [Deltaproteobacteria bacterium Smac51]
MPGLPWYGLAYAAAFALAWIAARRLKWPENIGPAFVDGLMLWCLAGAIVGGRLGYVIGYEPGYYLAHPAEIPHLWRGGMSFHGGLAGALAAVRLWSGPKLFLPSLDRVALITPLALFFGRLGNFFNGELWGTVSSVPWAIVFPAAGPQLRHPSPLYEAALEGPILWIILWLYARRCPADGCVAAMLAVAYGLMRFGLEFFRQPDAAWGYLAWGWLTWGQVLSLILTVVGLIFFRRFRRRTCPMD